MKRPRRLDRRPPGGRLQGQRARPTRGRYDSISVACRAQWQARPKNGFESPTPGLVNAGRLPTIIGQGAVAGRSGDDTAKWMAGPRRVSRSLPGEISTKGLEGRWLPFDRSGVIRQLDRGTAAGRHLSGAIRLTQADLSVQIQSNFPFADSSLTMFQNLVCGPRGRSTRPELRLYFG